VGFTSARKYTDLQVEASLPLSAYSYAVGLGRFAGPGEVRLRFDVLTKTRQPELQRCWTTRDRAANVRLFRLAAEVLRAIEAGVFHLVVGWQCRECPFGSRCWAWGWTPTDRRVPGQSRLGAGRLLGRAGT
jgi:hypothetical protein